MPDPIVDPSQNPDPTPSPEPAKTFSQEEVNSMMGKVRAEAKAPFSDYDELKGRAAKADELERAAMSESQKMAQDLEIEKRNNADLKGDISNVYIGAAVQVEAARMGIVDPDAALLLINRSGITYSGEHGVLGVKDALTALVAEKTYLIGTPNPAPNLNPGPGSPAAVAASLTPAQKDIATRVGMTAEAYAKGIVVKE